MHVPDGIAHFLEHKLFEQEDGNMLEKVLEAGVFAQRLYLVQPDGILFYMHRPFDENFQDAAGLRPESLDYR